MTCLESSKVESVEAGDCEVFSGEEAGSDADVDAEEGSDHGYQAHRLSVDETSTG